MDEFIKNCLDDIFEYAHLIKIAQRGLEESKLAGNIELLVIAIKGYFLGREYVIEKEQNEWCNGCYLKITCEHTHDISCPYKKFIGDI